MKALLLNIDSKLPNLALHKIAKWHDMRGDEVLWNMPMTMHEVDIVYASCIFTDNKKRPQNENERKAKKIKNRLGLYCDDVLGLRSDAVVGGTGYSLKEVLPKEIDEVKPRINYGFTTRGCIRKCKFCFVWRTEGYIKAVDDIYGIWDGQERSIVLYDNNILALPEHFALVSGQLIKEKLSVDFNQGLDIRLLTPEACETMQRLRFSGDVRFAFDTPKLDGVIEKGVGLLRRYDIRSHPFFYVLVGFDTTFEEDLYRLNVLRGLERRAYVMKHQETPREKRYTRLSQWANQFWTFASFTYEEFCKAYELDAKGLYKRKPATPLF